MTMREKMARAMHDRMNARFGTDSVWDSAEQSVKDKFLDYADAALDALMEPTEGMIMASGDWQLAVSITDTWAAMIRAAKEGK